MGPGGEPPPHPEGAAALAARPRLTGPAPLRRHGVLLAALLLLVPACVTAPAERAGTGDERRGAVPGGGAAAAPSPRPTAVPGPSASPERDEAAFRVAPALLRLAAGVRRRVVALLEDGDGSRSVAWDGVRWSSARGEVAAVSDDGVVTGRRPGSTVVRAELGDRTAAVRVVVTERAGTDRIDDARGSQVHVLYVLPGDGDDRRLDLDGTVEASVARIQRWLSGQTGGWSLRMDTYRGRLDVSFLRLRRTDAWVRDRPSVREHLEAELTAAGFDDPSKIYAVYYDGGADTCGGGAWPPDLPGTVAAQYLRGTPPGAPPCAAAGFPSGPSADPGYPDFGMLHEVLHTMGFVDRGAPNRGEGAHVLDSRHDLLYGGGLPWEPSVLDAGRDDYFGEAVPPGVRTLTDSPYLVRD